MTEPITPYSTLQMTLEVERQQQIEHMQQYQEQGALAQQLDKKKELKQRQVNARDEAEGERVRKDGENQSEARSGSEEEEKKEEKEEKNRGNTKKKKGNIVDVKI
ncbi:MAG: hypothetical protein ACOCZR_00340 [Halanaerobiales bacterium]